MKDEDLTHKTVQILLLAKHLADLDANERHFMAPDSLAEETMRRAIPIVRQALELGHLLSDPNQPSV